MTDKNVSLEASDRFGLGGNFIAQSGSEDNTRQFAAMLKANGDNQKYSDAFDEKVSVSVEYRFNAVTGLGSALPNVGSVQNGFLIDSVGVTTTENDYPSISVAGHNHTENAHTTGNEFAFPAGVISDLTGAVGAYDFFDKSGGDVCTTGSSVTLSANHIDANCLDHFVGTTVDGLLTASVTYLGAPSTPTTVSGWRVTSDGDADGNTNHDTATITAEQSIARAT